ncbi:putative DNA repair protein/CtIP [Colletotrichum sublineola]|uniref:Putative DNA repair protein/CtIP n=1 Tax=Colletotrichum sublineola TaxID=1173701 RepID=A0A066X9E7_COLSU|nr:putative DNA repair protein/CtIP [Colletotrichum sublineola]
MESWSPASRAAVQNAFNALRETISKEAQNEVEQRLKENNQTHALLTDELEILRSRSAEVDRLEEENRKLRTKLLQFHQQTRSTESSRDSPRPNYVSCDQATNTDSMSTVNFEKGHELEQVLRESQKLRRKYNALDQNFKILKSEFNKRRDENKRWEEYATNLEAKIKLFEKSRKEPDEDAHSTEALSEPSRPQVVLTSGYASDPGAGPVSTRETAESTRHIPFKSVAATTSTTITTTTGKDATRDPTPEESTEGETTEGSKDDDVLTLPPLRQPPKTDSDIRIKPEPSSDGPVVVSERFVGKRKHSDDSIEQQGRRRIKVESSNIAGDPFTSQLQQESMDLDEVGQKLRLVDAGRAKTTAPLFVRPDNTGTPTAKNLDSSTVLTPVNPNARPMRPHEVKTVEKPTKKGLAHSIESLAEDGLIYEKSGRGGLAEAQLRTPQPPGRLSTLLNMPSPEQAPAIVRSAPRLRGMHRASADNGPQFPERRELPFSKERRERLKETTSIRNELDETTEHGTPRPLSRNRSGAHTPLPAVRGSLRTKPVASMRLEDFKVNPKFNDGSDYAYSEVVRGKDDRACLPGCTDMNCCGKQFRAMALAQRNNAERTLASDTKLFEDYLGDRVAITLGMSKAEKDELWVEAKTWQLANELGKHRHRYARRPSPPGFWNADFPTTQEVEDEKSEAEKRERHLIRESRRLFTVAASFAAAFLASARLITPDDRHHSPIWCLNRALAFCRPPPANHEKVTHDLRAFGNIALAHPTRSNNATIELRTDYRFPLSTLHRDRADNCFEES